MPPPPHLNTIYEQITTWSNVHLSVFPPYFQIPLAQPDTIRQFLTDDDALHFVLAI